MNTPAARQLRLMIGKKNKPLCLATLSNLRSPFFPSNLNLTRNRNLTRNLPLHPLPFF